MFFETPTSNYNFAEPEIKKAPSTFGQNFSAQFDVGFYIDHQFAYYNAVEQAYEKRIKAIRQAIPSAKLSNPSLLQRYQTLEDGLDREEVDPHEQFKLQLRKLADENPHLKDVIRPDEDIRASAALFQRDVDRRAADVGARYKGVYRDPLLEKVFQYDQVSPLAMLYGGVNSSWLPGILGGFTAMATDPVNVGSALLLPGIGGAAGKGTSGLLWMAGKQAALNAAVEAALQPGIQYQRALAGVDYGVSNAALNVAAAGLFGGAVDLAGRGAYRAITGAKGVDPAPKAPRGTSKAEPQPVVPDVTPEPARAPDIPPELIAKAESGDVEAAREVIKRSGAQDDPDIQAIEYAITVEDRTQKQIDELVGGPINVEGVTVLDRGDTELRLANALRAAADDLEPPRVGETAPARTVPSIADDDALRAAAKATNKGFDQLTIEGRPAALRQLEAKGLTTDPELFISRRGGAPDGAKWDAESAGRLVVFEDANGRLIVADGQKRLELAQRVASEGEDVPALDAVVFREKDGWSARDVEAIALRRNIEDSIDPLEIARSIRRAPEIVDGKLALDSDIMQAARGLARLSDEAFAAAEAGTVPQHVAAAVGDHVPDRALHRQMLDELAATDPQSPAEARLNLREMLADAPENRARAQAVTLGSHHGDVVFAVTHGRHRVRLFSEMMDGLYADPALRDMLVREAQAVDMGPPPRIDTPEQQVAYDAVRVALLMERSLTPGSQGARILDEAARSLAQGFDAADVRTAMLNRMRKALLGEVAYEKVVRLEHDLELLRKTSESSPQKFADPETGEPLTASDISGIVDMWLFVKDMKKKKKPKSLTQFVVERGGVSDEHGDVAHILGAKNSRPGLINKNGDSLDDSALAAWQAGYLGTGDRPTVADFVNALDEDIRGSGVYANRDFDAVEDIRVAQEMEIALEQLGIAGATTEADIRRHFAATSGNRSSSRASVDIQEEVSRISREIADTRPERGTGLAGLSSPVRDAAIPGTPGDEVFFAIRSYREGKVEPFGGMVPRRTDWTGGPPNLPGIDNLGYFSRAIQAASELKQAKGTPEQMLAQLKKAGVKDAEIEATGLREFMAGKKSVTRDDVIEHLEANRTDVREVRNVDPRVASGEAKLSAKDRLRDVVHDIVSSDHPLSGFMGRRTSLARRLRDAVSKADGSVSVLALPEHAALVAEDSSLQQAVRAYAMLPDRSVFRVEESRGTAPRWHEWSIDAGNPTYRETVLHLPDGADAFRSGHWEEPNVIAHLRTSVQTDASGARVLVLNELQSDWGQKLRDGGVRDEAKIAELRAKAEAATKAADAQWDLAKSGDLAAVAEMRRLAVERDRVNAELSTAEAATPGHPLVNTTDQWTNTALRRLIRQAIEDGVDRIAIASGETVDSFGMGAPLKGLQYAYNEMYPKKLRDLLKKIDPAAAKPERVETLASSDGSKQLGKGFTVFSLTDKVRQQVAEQGQPLFSMRTRRPLPHDTARTVYTDAAAEIMPELRKEIMAVTRMLPDNVRIEVQDRIVMPIDGGGRAVLDGYFDPVDSIIRVALDAADPTSVPSHEAIHALRKAALFTGDEWQTLSAYARRHKLREKFEIDTRYGDAYRKMFPDPNRFEEALIEETIAHAFAAWRKGERFGGRIDRIIDRVVQFLNRVAQMLGEKGFRRAEDVFKRIETGKVGRRPRYGLADYPTRIEDIGPNDPHPGPIFVEHGTIYDFEQFNPRRSGHFGVHFGTRKQANTIIEHRVGQHGLTMDGGRVIPAVLDVRNVLDVRDAGNWRPRDVLEMLQDRGVQFTDDEIKVIRRAEIAQDQKSAHAAFGDALTRAGYDALRYRNNVEGAGWSYVVWKPGSVLSATMPDRRLFSFAGERALSADKNALERARQIYDVPEELQVARDGSGGVMASIRNLIGTEPTPGVYDLGDMPTPRRAIYDNHRMTYEAKRATELHGASERSFRLDAIRDLDAGLPVTIGADTVNVVRSGLEQFADLLPQDVRFGAVGSITPLDGPGKLVKVGVIRDLSRGVHAVTESVVLPRDVLFQSQAIVSRDGKAVLIFNLGGENLGHAFRGQVAKVLAESALVRGEIAEGLVARLLRHVRDESPLEKSLGAYAAERGDMMNPAIADRTLREYYNLRYKDDPQLEQILQAKSIGHLVEDYASGRMPEDAARYLRAEMEELAPGMRQQQPEADDMRIVPADEAHMRRELTQIERMGDMTDVVEACRR